MEDNIELNIGDKVVLKSDFYNTRGLVSYMMSYSGKTATIINKEYSYGCADYIYKIDIDYGRWNWVTDNFVVRGISTENTRTIVLEFTAQIMEAFKSNLNVGWDTNLILLAGQRVKIESVEEDGVFLISHNNNFYKWLECGFAPVDTRIDTPPTDKTELEVGDYVLISPLISAGKVYKRGTNKYANTAAMVDMAGSICKIREVREDNAYILAGTGCTWHRDDLIKIDNNSKIEVGDYVFVQDTGKILKVIDDDVTSYYVKLEDNKSYEGKADINIEYVKRKTLYKIGGNIMQETVNKINEGINIVVGDLVKVKDVESLRKQGVDYQSVLRIAGKEARVTATSRSYVVLDIDGGMELRKSYVIFIAHDTRTNEEKFVEILKFKISYRLRSLANNIDTFSRSVAKLESDLKLTNQKLESGKHELKRLESTYESDIEKMLKGFESITDIRGIKSYEIDVENKKIILYTDFIIATEPKSGVRYSIGEFKISINILDNNIRFANLTQTKPGYWSGGNMHPHISAEGSACFGNVSSMITELISALDFKSLAMVIVNYLESINIDDNAGKYCRNWDSIDEKGNIIAPANSDLCPHCGRDTDDGEDTRHCADCGTEICIDCGHMPGGDWLCDDCL